MTDRERLLAEPAPRSDGTCVRYSFTYEGVAGFIAYGVLWAFLALPVSIGTMVIVSRTYPWLGFGLGSVVMWGLYFVWIARRTAPARRFFREAVIVDGRLTRVIPGTGRNDGMATFVVAFNDNGREMEATCQMFTGRNNHDALVVGSTAQVMFVPGEARCGVFPFDGKLRMGSLQG